jgi:hypothetical protein
MVMMAIGSGRYDIKPDRYEVTRDEEPRTYTIRAFFENVILWTEKKSSVTQTLKDVGIVDYAGVDPYYADRGTRAHNDCNLMAAGWLRGSDWRDYVHTDTVGYVETFKAVCDRLGLRYIACNVKGYSEKFDLAGECDLIMDWEGRRTVVELKTGDFPQWGGLQLAGYEDMFGSDDVLGIELKTGRVFIKAPTWEDNPKTLGHIINGTFDLDEWKSNRKRRCMRVLK